jgi:hypothetical protein
MDVCTGSNDESNSKDESISNDESTSDDEGISEDENEHGWWCCGSENNKAKAASP